MVKLPSLQTLAQQTVSIIKRFPLTILSAVVLTAICIHLTHRGTDFREGNDYLLSKIAMCCGLGLSFFLAVSLFSEANDYSRNIKIILQLIALGIITGYYFTIEKYENFNLDTVTRYTLYILASHLFVAFSPFTGPNRINGFWQFNKTLFLRLLLSGLYTGVLYGGIAIAFLLMDGLLHITIQFTKYAYTWYILFGILNTFIFLGGIPKDLHMLESDVSYPKGLKAFTQFVLLPLVSLYLLILYIYFTKIIIHWSLPKGYVSYLVISFSIMGILSLLLIYPVRNNEENQWIKIFSRWFYVALYPLIVLLAISIFHRLDDYGITEHRYFILLLALWLVFIAAYFLVSKKENIKIIPISLFIISILSSFGPWGAFSISHYSQKNRLEKLLTANGILVNDKVVKASKSISDSDRDNIQSIVRYLEDANSLKILQPWFTQNLDSVHPSSQRDYITATDSILKIMGISSYSYPYHASGFEFSLANRYYKNSIVVKGYDYYSEFNYHDYSSDGEVSDTAKYHDYFLSGPDTISFVPFHLPCKFGLVKHGKTIAILELDTLITTLHRKYDTNSNSYSINVPQDKFMNEQTGADSIVYRFLFSEIGVVKKNNQYWINELNTVILTKHL
jgi:hypothetical protein